MLSFGDKVLIAVSGGPDSIVLLYSLKLLQDFFGLKLYIAHLDHMLRRDSFQDLVFVKGIANNLNIPIKVKRINIKKFASKGSLEEIARNIRLDFLINTAKAIKADKIALGHTKDDQAETVLMRIIRGCGLYGLCSIFPVRNIRGFTLIRPLIETERKDIEIFLKKLKIKPRRDATNNQVKFFRNKIRNKLLPIIKKEYNPQIKQALVNLAKISAQDYDLIEYLGQNSLKKCKLRLSKKILSLDLNKFLKLHKGLQRMVFRLAIERLIGTTRRFTFKHWQEIEDLIYESHSGSILNLPRQISVSKLRDRIVLTLRNP